MSWDDNFYCTFCGEKFRSNPLKLALHIRNNHIDRSPNKK